MCTIPAAVAARFTVDTSFIFSSFKAVGAYLPVVFQISDGVPTLTDWKFQSWLSAEGSGGTVDTLNEATS